MRRSAEVNRDRLDVLRQHRQHPAIFLPQRPTLPERTPRITHSVEVPQRGTATTAHNWPSPTPAFSAWLLLDLVHAHLG
jgi:hypothetical protein